LRRLDTPFLQRPKESGAAARRDRERFTVSFLMQLERGVVGLECVVRHILLHKDITLRDPQVFVFRVRGDGAICLRQRFIVAAEQQKTPNAEEGELIAPLGIRADDAQIARLKPDSRLLRGR
jgi:hypothetical protein